MEKNVKKAFIELYSELKKQLNDAEAYPICEFYSEPGSYPTFEKDCDDNGNWGFRKACINISEEDAIKDAQDTLLNGVGRIHLDDMFFEGELRNKLYDFMDALAHEVAKC